jgi:hypothetical protein
VLPQAVTSSNCPEMEDRLLVVFSFFVCVKVCLGRSRTTDLITTGKPLNLRSTCVENPRHISSSSDLISTAHGRSEVKDGEPRKRSRFSSINNGPDSSYMHSYPLQHRVEEEGMFSTRKPMHVYIMCEQFPVWLPCVSKL